MTTTASKYAFWLWLCSLASFAGAAGAVVHDTAVHDPLTHDAAAAAVQSLNASLLSSMQAGPQLSTTERYHRLEPVILKTFDLPLMTRLSVGPPWSTFSAEQQQAVVGAFTRLTIASYAHNFREFGGEKFTVDDAVASRESDKIVRSQIIPLHDAPATLVFRMRQSAGLWRIIDVFYDGVSELTMRRSDFSAAVAAGGATALINHINQVSDGLMKP